MKEEIFLGRISVAYGEKFYWKRFTFRSQSSAVVLKLMYLSQTGFYRNFSGIYVNNKSSIIDKKQYCMNSL